MSCPSKIDHLAAADGLEHIGVGDHHARILAQADADGVGVAGHGLAQTAEAAAFHEVAVDDHILDQGGAGGHLHTALHQPAGAVALVDHGAAHAHGARAGAGDHETGLLMVAALHELQEGRSTEDGSETELVPAAHHHAIGLGQSLDHVRLHVGAFADVEHIDVLRAQTAEGFDVIRAHLERNAAGAGDHGDAGIGATHLVHHALQDALFNEGALKDLGIVPAFGFRALVLVTADGDEFAFWVHVLVLTPAPDPAAVACLWNLDR